MQKGYTGTKLNVQEMLHSGSVQYNSKTNQYNQFELETLWSCYHYNRGLGFDSPYLPSS